MNSNREEKCILQPTEINYFLKYLAHRYTGLTKNEFHTIKRFDKNYVICPLSKDAETSSNEPEIPFIGDVIANFMQNNQRRNFHLLIPMKLCRGYLKIPTAISYAQRQHFVLVELDLSTMNLQVHDSLNNQLRIYPDKFIELDNIAGVPISYQPAKDYHAYAKQKDKFSAIYYVLTYIESILELGESSQCSGIKLDVVDTYKNKADFFKQKQIPEYVVYLRNNLPTRSDIPMLVVNNLERQLMVEPEDSTESPTPLLANNLFKNQYKVDIEVIEKESPKPHT